jgi:hypothetical protein
MKGWGKAGSVPICAAQSPLFLKTTALKKLCAVVAALKAEARNVRRILK